MRDLVSNQGGRSEKGHPRSSSGLPKHPQVDPEGGRAEERRQRKQGFNGKNSTFSSFLSSPFLFAPLFSPPPHSPFISIWTQSHEYSDQAGLELLTILQGKILTTQFLPACCRSCTMAQEFWILE